MGTKPDFVPDQSLSDFFNVQKTIEAFYVIRKEAVEKEFETPELSALMIETFGEGISKLLNDKGAALRTANTYCEMIDPKYQENCELRSKCFAKLDLSDTYF